jgi:hypothetical protein
MRQRDGSGQTKKLPNIVPSFDQTSLPARISRERGRDQDIIQAPFLADKTRIYIQP